MRRPRTHAGRNIPFAKRQRERDLFAQVLDLDRIQRYVNSLGPHKMRRLKRMFGYEVDQ